MSSNDTPQGSVQAQTAGGGGVDSTAIVVGGGVALLNVLGAVLVVNLLRAWRRRQGENSIAKVEFDAKAREVRSPLEVQDVVVNLTPATTAPATDRVKYVI